MITSIKFKNYKVFYKEVSMSFVADAQIKRFLCNSAKKDNINVLKVACFYGPNNTGKTCLVLALRSLRTLMLDEPHDDLTNSFVEDDVISYSVEYIQNESFYRYSVDYNCKEKRYINEKLCALKIQDSNHAVISQKVIVERNNNKVKLEGLDKDFSEKLLMMVSDHHPILIALSSFENEILRKARQDYIDFANSIELLKMEGDIDLSKTIELIKTDKNGIKFIKEFVNNCDLDIDDFGYDEDIRSDVDLKELTSNQLDKNTMSFYSNHNGYRVPSFVFDSLGTKKIIALSGYIYDALKNEKILLVDELNSSLHHILTKAIIAMFNNELNSSSQLFFNTHDLLLMDLRTLFRKDQIFLTDISWSFFSGLDSCSNSGCCCSCGSFCCGIFNSVPITFTW